MEEQLKKISLRKFEIANVFPSLTPTTDSWSVDKDFKLKIEIVEKEGMRLEFDLINLEQTSFANALRRIMLSEVPSMAIEKVHLLQNTSIIQALKDEVLAHRLGLIPLRADPRLFSMKAARVSDVAEDERHLHGDEDEESLANDIGTDEDTLEFELSVRCKWKPNINKHDDTLTPDQRYVNHQVLSSDIKWVPREKQREKCGEKEPKVVHDDILIAKLRPGQEIECKLYAVKGIGADHAKFSPVATAFYRLRPEIRLKERVSGEKAMRLQKCFSPGVIEVRDEEAVVVDARYDSCSRNHFMHDDLENAVEVSKDRTHFIFDVESVGAMEPEDIFVEAINVLRDKCKHFLKELEEVQK